LQANKSFAFSTPPYCKHRASLRTPVRMPYAGQSYLAGVGIRSSLSAGLGGVLGSGGTPGNIARDIFYRNIKVSS